MEKQIYNFIRAGESYVKDRVDTDIERSRKALFGLVIADGGKPVSGDVTVEAKMTDIDFNFGANIFMLNQYEDERDEMYKKEFTSSSTPPPSRSTGRAPSRPAGTCATPPTHRTTSTVVRPPTSSRISVKRTAYA